MLAVIERSVKTLRLNTFALARAFDAERGTGNEGARLLSYGLAERGPVDSVDLTRISNLCLHDWLQWPDEASAVPEWRESVRTLAEDARRLTLWRDGRQ